MLASLLLVVQDGLSIITSTNSSWGALLTSQWAEESELGGMYTLFNNLWGEAAATSGNQSTQETSSSGTSVAWETTWNWEGASSSVKSYANLGINNNLGKSLSSISSIPTTWDWTYTEANDVVADVSYDLWLSNTAEAGTANAQSTYEVMIWLSARGGAGPVGSQVATANIAGTEWALHQGIVETWTTFSFVAPSETTSFSADLLDFLNYLVDNYDVSASSNFFSGGGAGTEPFTGSAVLTTTGISIVVN